MQKLRYHNTTVWWNLIIICVLLVSCGQKSVKTSLAERKSLDSIISLSRNLDTLSMLQKRMESEGNMLGSVIAYKEMGKIMRNDSKFDDALRLHSEGLKQAEEIDDTLEMVQALNNIGRLSAYGSARFGAGLSLPCLDDKQGMARYVVRRQEKPCGIA